MIALAFRHPPMPEPPASVQAALDALQRIEDNAARGAHVWFEDIAAVRAVLLDVAEGAKA
jgi:hypothetical protein